MSESYYYEIRDIEHPQGIKLNQARMIRYAKKMLSINKRVHGLDKGVSSKDLSSPINAWVYLKNIGLGKKTNRTKW